MNLPRVEVSKEITEEMFDCLDQAVLNADTGVVVCVNGKLIQWGYDKETQILTAGLESFEADEGYVPANGSLYGDSLGKIVDYLSTHENKRIKIGVSVEDETVYLHKIYGTFL